MNLQLYCFGESGHSYKAALALELSGLAWRPVFVDFFNGETRSTAYRENINAMGEAPVLIIGEQKLTQSGVILQKISQLSGRFGGNTEEEEREILRWILWDNGKLTSIVGMTRFLMNFVPVEKRPEAVIAFHQARLKNSYQVLEGHLKTRDWIVGDEISIADFSCCGYFYYPEPFGFDRGDWPAIDAWLTRLSRIPGWKAPYDLMPGTPSRRA